jgi:fructokinase
MCDDTRMAKRRIVVGLGEILWDVFPNGPHFGGAPANFACSVAELCGGAINVVMVGSIGRDELGRQAIELLNSHGVDTSCVSANDWPTGQVLVTLDEAGKPNFEIATDTAWDNMAWSEELESLAARADAICFGTLAQRSPTSRRTIRNFLQASRSDCLRILDINLRPPFWNKEVVRESFELVNVLKLNDAELATLADIMDWPATDDELLSSLLDTNAFRMVALTRGPDGSTLMNAAGDRSDLAGQPTKIADTVGAGDAFTAALAIGMLCGESLDEINSRANRVAAFVCSQPGGTPHFPAELQISKLDLQ